MIDRVANALRTFGPKHGVTSAMLFGSVARGEGNADSDIDLFVEFDGPTTFDRFMGLKLDLEDALHRRVDLVTRQAIRPHVLERVS
ncbi:MAG: nucleotidyltransferase family protein [Phycisphaerae bacterium]|nr:nucleotidyltransferase family protein [Phycisphaerae bacterium]